MKSIPTTLKIIKAMIILGLMLASCSYSFSSVPTHSKTRYREPYIPSPISPTPPYFVDTPCRFPLPPGEVRCGDLFVYEDRTDPTSRVISLHVGIFPSYASDPAPDPLIYLIGGGGADTLSYAEFYHGNAGALIRGERDFILYNQRGVKYNDPHLACPDEDSFWEEIYAQDLSKSEIEKLEIQFLRGCRQELADQEINPDQYDSLAHAGDLADLISTLGYDNANIYGVSYGTRTGLTLMRYFPHRVRSAILDGVLPPQINFPSDAIPSFIGSLEAIFNACQAQTECINNYPDLEQDLSKTLNNLQSDPVPLTIGETMINLDPPLFLEALFRLAHSTAALPSIPEAIHHASQGNYSWFYDSIQSARTYSDFITTGVNYSTICRDEVLFDSLENNQEQASPYPETWQAYLDLSSYYRICQDWVEEPADPIENTPVVSDIPTLIMTGHFDPITSPAWSADTAAYLENAYYFEFPNLAHGVLRFDSCAMEIGLDFLDDPWQEPDTSCLDALGPPVFK